MSQKEPESRHNRKAQRWAMLVGVDCYEDPTITPLRYCASDARALYDLLISKPEYGYERDRLCLLVSEDREHAAAKRVDILKNLNRLASAVNDEDLLLFYFAGHGHVVDGEAYILPTDAFIADLLPDTAIPLRRIKEIIQSSKARAKVIILDVCHCGVELGRTVQQQEAIFIKNVLEEAEGIAILASATREEIAWESSEKGHGVFTYYLIEGLKGEANSRHDQFITLNEIFNYVTQHVKEWSKSQPTSQRPNLEFKGVGEIVLLTTAATVVDLEAQPDGLRRENLIVEQFPAPVREQEDFYDRAPELRHVERVFEARVRKSIVIQGSRCIGKTSFINRIMRVLDQEKWQRHKFFHFSIGSKNASSCAEFARELWDGMLNCSSGIDPPAEIANLAFEFNTVNQFAAQLRKIQSHRPDTTFVVFIDEFDNLFHGCENLEYERITGLIHYIIESTDFPMLFFISTLQDLPAAYGSPFPKDPIPLHPFDRADSDRIVMDLIGVSTDLTDKVLSWIYEYMGGHPYFIKLLIVKLFELYRLNDLQQTISLEMVQRAAQGAMSSRYADDVLGDIYRKYLDDDERYILLWTASYQKGTLTSQDINKARAQLKGAFKRLEKQDYFIEREDNSYCLQMGLLRDWLRNWSEFESEIGRLQVPGQDGISSQIVPEGICIDLTTQRVYVDGREIEDHIGDEVYRALIYLAQYTGQVVSKNEFANHIWQEEYYEGDDQRISQLISRLRKVLKDKQKPYKYLETLPKRGFRLQRTTLVGSKPVI